MLKRLAAPAVALLLGATMATALPPGTAMADCHEDGGVVICDANDGGQQAGSGGNDAGGSGNGGATGPGPGCQNQGGGVPGQGCTNNPPAAQQDILSSEWAAQARSLLQPPAPEIHWTPEPRTYVQLRTGLWLDPQTFDALQSPPAGAGGETVVAYATPKRVEWNLVESTIQCPNAGSPDGTQCGYTYKRSSAAQPGGNYQITATAVYDVTWICTGDCDQANGRLADLVMPATDQLPVDEIQTESQPG
jgi:hypothetical protein